jgi:hypothetical protein
MTGKELDRATKIHLANITLCDISRKVAAYTHLVFLGWPVYPAPKIADVEPKTREKYSGPLALGGFFTACL